MLFLFRKKIDKILELFIIDTYFKGGKSMTNINQKQMERLFCIETSLTNLYQKIMTLEKEGKIDTKEYLEGVEQLKFIKAVEMLMVQEIYEQYGIEEILNLFEDASNCDCLYSVLELKRILDVKTRIVQLFLEYSYQDKMDLKPRKAKVLLDEKCQYIGDILFLHDLINLIQKRIDECFYKETFTTLKYNAIYTYPYLERYLFHEKISACSLCFLYNMNSKETDSKIQRFSEEEAFYVYLKLEEFLSVQENKSLEHAFNLEMLLVTLKSYLFHIGTPAFQHLHGQFKNLQLEKSIVEEGVLEKDVLREIGNIFTEVLDEKMFKEQEVEKQYVKRDYLKPIEFYK